jgi:diguanylate cyclase (GGDEF)-like protein/PAS domain S-box-containing protein
VVGEHAGWTQPCPGLVDSLPEAVVVVDLAGIVTWANATAERLLGHAPGESVGTVGLSLVHPDDQHLALLSLVSVQSKEVGSPIELRMATADGWRLMEVIGAPLDQHHIVLSIRDITQRRRWEVAGDETARFRSLVQNSPNLTMLVRPDGTVVSASGAITRLLGHDPEHVCGQLITQLVDPGDRDVVCAAINQARSSGAPGGSPIWVEASLLAGSGRTVPYEMAIVSLLDDPTVEGLVIAAHDITRLRAAQEALTELANFDSLTGLANRRAFELELEREWSLTSRDGIDSFLVIADLDRFKQVNDRHGHAAGDAALRGFAHALRLAVRETDMIGRLGGDEFGVILVRCGGEPAALGLGPHLREIMNERIAACAEGMSVSLGYTSLRSAVSPADAFERADAAMFAAKRSRRASQHGSRVGGVA